MMSGQTARSKGCSGSIVWFARVKKCIAHTKNLLPMHG
jgi:hypothetical protein